MGSWPLTWPGQHLQLLLHFRIPGKHISHRLSGCFLSLWTDLDIEDPSFLVNGGDQSLSSPLDFDSGCVSLEGLPGQELDWSWFPLLSLKHVSSVFSVSRSPPLPPMFCD